MPATAINTMQNQNSIAEYDISIIAVYIYNKITVLL